MLWPLKIVNLLTCLPVCRLKKDFFLCILSAIFLILSFPNFNLWIFAWFGFVPLFFAIQNKSKTKAFLISYIAGVIFWASVIYWLVHVTLPGTILLILYLALYFGFFGLFYTLYAIRYPLISIPSLWVLLEYIRSHLFTGFPWALLGYSQYLNLPVIQIADITGAAGISFLVMMVNVLIYSVISRKSSVVSSKQRCLLPVLLLFITLVYGYFKIYYLPLITYHLPLKISVIQGNIPQELKWDISSRSYILDRYIQLTEKAVALKPDLIIWPEASTPGLLGENNWGFEEVFDLSKKAKIPLLIGSVVKDGANYFNSALLVDTEGKVSQRYNKLHLVPFGEYIPFKKTFPFLETVVPIGDITAGKEYTVFSGPVSRLAGEPVSRLAGERVDRLAGERVNGLTDKWVNRQTGKLANRQTKFSVLICFEDLFPELSRRFVKRGAQFLVNITNDAWYKKTSASRQHLQASVFRAVENRLYLARCANTGISGFIEPTGKIISRVKDESGRDTFISGVDTREIGISKKSLSFYTKYGDIFIAICFLFIAISMFFRRAG